MALHSAANLLHEALALTAECFSSLPLISPALQTQAVAGRYGVYRSRAGADFWKNVSPAFAKTRQSER